MTNVALGKPVLEAGQDRFRKPGEATNGKIDGYTSGTGYTSFKHPGTLTVDLGATHSLFCIRFLLWDLDDRTYTYRLWSATDKDGAWTLLHDSSETRTKGWQVFNFPNPIEARYVRVQGLSNTKNPYFHIVELEAHDAAPDTQVRAAVTETLALAVGSTSNKKPEDSQKKTCFIIMPIVVPEDLLQQYDGDPDHFQNVLQHLFVPAVENAGYIPRLPKAKGSEVITVEIIRYLRIADLVLCDISALRPNVFFELGVRTALNKPVAYVRDAYTEIPFDIGTVNHYQYETDHKIWSKKDAVEELKRHLNESVETSNGKNNMWKAYTAIIDADEK